MKLPHTNALLVVLMGFTPFAFAQTPNGPLTREQVLQDLCDLEAVGYRPAQASSLRFPYDIEAAEQRVAARKRAEPPRSAPGSASRADPGSDESSATGLTARP